MTGAVTTGSGNPIHQTELPDVLIVRPRRHGDARGWFSETFRMSWFESASAPTFVQDNHSFTALPSTVRGLHFQAPPHAQAKLVRVSRGAVFDVVVDIRVGSPTYGRHVSAILSADGWEQLFVPVGFAHGFCTIEPDTEVLYKASDYYAPDHDRGLRWDDPALGIPWPIDPADALLSDKDRVHPTLADLPHYFTYQDQGND